MSGNESCGGIPVRIRAGPWSCCFWTLFLRSGFPSKQCVGRIESRHDSLIYSSGFFFFRTKRGVGTAGSGKGGWFRLVFTHSCSSRFLPDSRKQQGSSYGIQEGRSVTSSCLCVLGYPEWSRAFTCTILAERGVLVIALLRQGVLCICPQERGGLLLHW